MNKNFRVLLLVLVVGVLAVAVILTFIALGVSNLVPWLLSAVLIAIPFLMLKKDKEQFVEWKDEYSVGIDSLDNDHRKLLALINNLQTAIHYQTDETFEREALNEVVAYTKYHFEREEKMMQDAGYADLEAHVKGHNEMIAKVDEFQKDYENQGHEALETVALFLRDWLVQHINGTDKEYSEILKEKGMS